ncbi:hypothetical protein HMPREF1326_03066 [Akkermansia sp. KLE1605]|nr:hypothetical protein HMPREF1326_03066 [Akkermansia sp. KLE1605]
MRCDGGREACFTRQCGFNPRTSCEVRPSGPCRWMSPVWFQSTHLV